MILYQPLKLRYFYVFLETGKAESAEMGDGEETCKADVVAMSIGDGVVINDFVTTFEIMIFLCILGHH